MLMKDKIMFDHYIKINPPLVKDTGNISRESCKSGKQTSAHVRNCIQDLQVSREIFPIFPTTGTLRYTKGPMVL